MAATGDVLVGLLIYWAGDQQVMCGALAANTDPASDIVTEHGRPQTNLHVLLRQSARPKPKPKSDGS